MQLKFNSAGRKAPAYVLILTLFFLAVSLTIFGGLLYWSSGTSIQTARNNQYIRSQAAAEAAVETALSAMNRDFLFGSISNNASYQPWLPQTNNWPILYQFSNTNSVSYPLYVNVSAQSGNSVPLGKQFSGLSGYTRDCTISVTATPLNQPYNVPATVSLDFQMASIPVFQYAIFYNLDLEINPGHAMYINGKVFCNDDIYATGASSSEPLTFADTVQANGNYFNMRKTGDSNGQRSGGVVFLNGTPTTGVPAVSLPIAGSTNNNPAIVRTILDLPPAAYAAPLDAAYSTNGQVYLFNSCDLVVSNAAVGLNSGVAAPLATNFVVYFQDSAKVGTNHLTPVPYDFYVISNKNSPHDLSSTNRISPLANKYIVRYAGYSFLTNVAFQDFREQSTVQAVELSVTNLGLWRTNAGNTYNNSCRNDKGHDIDSIYIYNKVPFTSSQLPAVRVVNGAKLPTSAGLTIATPFPLYVKGHYNVMDSTGTSIATLNLDHTWPSSLMADAITILSSSWDDSYTSSSTRTAVNTTVNAAAIEGIVQTFVDSNGNNHYSGGVENFIRLAEDWGGKVNTYNGSIVVLFESKYATNTWDHASYGVPSTRQWGFDTNFLTQTTLPPLTPQSKSIIRNSWTAHY